MPFPKKSRRYPVLWLITLLLLFITLPPAATQEVSLDDFLFPPRPLGVQLNTEDGIITWRNLEGASRVRSFLQQVRDAPRSVASLRVKSYPNPRL